MKIINQKLISPENIQLLYNDWIKKNSEIELKKIIYGRMVNWKLWGKSSEQGLENLKDLSQEQLLLIYNHINEKI